MRKRCVAMLLSLALSAAMIMETGAAAFDSEPSVVSESVEMFDDGVFSDTAVTEIPENTTEETMTEVSEEVTEEFQAVPEESVSEEAVSEDFVSEEVFTADVKEDSVFQSEAMSESSDGLDDTVEAGAGAMLGIQVQQSSWVAIDGKFKLKRNAASAHLGEFYTAADGIIHITTVVGNKAYTGNYMFDNAGFLITGRKKIAAGTPGYSFETEYEFYFTAANQAVRYVGNENSAITPWTSDLGQQKKNYWLWEDGIFRLYSSAGRYVTISELNESYKAQNKYVGYYKINGKYYCLTNAGKPRTGDIRINGVMYYFPSNTPIPGQMFLGGWIRKASSAGERWRYYNPESKGADKGKLLTYTGAKVTYLDKSVKGDYQYLLSEKGYILKSKRGKTADGSYYGTDSKGRILKEKMGKFGNYRYYFASNGKQVSWKNQWRRCKGRNNLYYYFGSTAGRVAEKTGWQKVTTTTGQMVGWFYFSSSGNHYVNRFTASNRYFDKDGKLASGIKTVNGKTYFFKVSSTTTPRGQMIKNTMIKYKDKWYYAQSNGVLWEKGWKTVEGNQYYFKNFVVQRDTFAWKGRTYGYLNASGKFCTGWVVYNSAENKVRYVNPSGGGFYKNTNAVINGLRYYFDANGFRINDLTGIYRGPYSLKVDRTNGVMTIYDASGTVPVKSMRVSVGNPVTLTPAGTYYLSRGLRWQPLMGPSWGQYGTHVDGAGLGGIFIHSIACGSPNSYNLPSSAYNRLGSPASHGCIRVCVGDAKWVYDNCHGAKITIFDGAYVADEVFKGPLGRKALVPLRYPYNFDPTDPAV